MEMEEITCERECEEEKEDEFVTGTTLLLKDSGSVTASNH